jgi:PAS domain S-box-containing protein
MNFEQACINLPIITLLIDPEDGKIIDANDKALEVYGYTKEELSKMTIKDINMLSEKQIEEEMTNAKNENRAFFYFPHKTSSGNIIDMEVESYPTTIDGKVLLYSLIQPSKKTNYLEKLFAKYFISSTNAILIVNNKMEIKNCNTSFLQMFNLTPNQIKGKGLSDIFISEEKKRINDFNNTLMKGKLSFLDTVIRNQETSIKYYSVEGIPTIYKDIFYGAVILFVNRTDKAVTEQKKAIKYKEALNKAEKYQQQKQEFFSRMSHNMKTPLNAILAYSEFGKHEKDPHLIFDYFNQINQSSKFLLELVEDVLNLNKIESGKIELNPTPMSKKDLITNVLKTINIYAKEKDIEIVTNFDTDMWDYHKFDIIRFEQIYINILHNAIKYSNKHSKVIWNKYYLKDKDGHPYFKNEIIDTGIGMPKDFIKHMFEPYAKVDNDLNKGIGLGLAISKNLIELLNGKIWCESKLGEGTKITFEIPACEISKEEYLNFVNKKINLDKIKDKKILICEDNEINIKIVNKILSSYKVETNIAQNGKIGLQKAKEDNYFAILMDLQMPVLNGYEATRKIRKFDKSTPIIAISANSYKEDINKALNSGMNEHLKKPIDQNELFKTLLKYV